MFALFFCLMDINYKGLTLLSPCSLVEKGSLGSASAQGNPRIARPLGGELLPAAPLQPCAEAPSGSGACCSTAGLSLLGPRTFASHHA